MSTTQAGVGLGRVFDVVYVAYQNAINLGNCNAVSLIVETSGAATLTLQAAKTFTGTPTNWSTANGFGQTAYWYESASTNGTAAWVKKTASWSTATITLSATTGYTSVLPIFTTQLADGYKYLYISAEANVTNVVAVLHDLAVQRTPANLTKLGA